MLQVVLILFVFMWAVLYYRVRDIFSPWSITLLVWVAVIAAYLYTDHGLYAVSNQFSKAILCWCVPFSVVGYVTYRLTPSYKGAEWQTNYSVVRLFFILALLVTPYALYKSVSFALQSGGNLMYAMRTQLIEDDSGFSLGPIAYFVHIIYTLVIVNADEGERFRRGAFIASMMVNFLFFFVLMSKLVLFIGILSTLYLFYVHHRVKLRTIVIAAASFLIIGVLFTQFRSTADTQGDSTFTFSELLGMYTLSPIVAFCANHPETSQYWGYETFRPVYHILEVLGLTQIPMSKGENFFISVPIPTNVYTMMAPLFADFGYKGIAIFGAIEASIVSWIFKKAVTGNTIARNVYAYLLAILALQFFDEQFYMGLSNIMQMVILILLCHIRFVWKPKSKFLFA